MANELAQITQLEKALAKAKTQAEVKGVMDKAEAIAHAAKRWGANRPVVLQALDILAGIDAWQLCHAQQRMRGIASRIQAVGAKGPYNTFTIRTSRPGGGKTEWQKRLEVIRLPRQGWELPALTIQAYMTDQTFTAMVVSGVVYTRDLYEFVDRPGLESFHQYRNVDGSGTFIAVHWDRLVMDGVRVKIVRPREIAATVLGGQMSLFDQGPDIC